MGEYVQGDGDAERSSRRACTSLLAMNVYFVLPNTAFVVDGDLKKANADRKSVV